MRFLFGLDSSIGREHSTLNTLFGFGLLHSSSSDSLSENSINGISLSDNCVFELRMCMSVECFSLEFASICDLVPILLWVLALSAVFVCTFVFVCERIGLVFVSFVFKCSVISGLLSRGDSLLPISLRLNSASFSGVCDVGMAFIGMRSFLSSACLTRVSLLKLFDVFFYWSHVSVVEHATFLTFFGLHAQFGARTPSRPHRKQNMRMIGSSQSIRRCCSDLQL